MSRRHPSAAHSFCQKPHYKKSGATNYRREFDYFAWRSIETRRFKKLNITIMANKIKCIGPRRGRHFMHLRILESTISRNRNAFKEFGLVI